MTELQKKPITASTIILCMCCFYPALNGYIRRVLLIPLWAIGIDISLEIFDLIIWGMVLLGILITAKRRVVGAKALLWYLGLACIAVISFGATSYDAFTAPVLVTLILRTLPFLLYGSLIRIDRISHRTLYWAAIVTLLVSIAYSVYTVDGKETKLDDNMDFAYKVLPSVLVIISWLFTKEKKVFAIVLTLVGVIFLILQGTRGPLLCVAIFVGLMFYKKFGWGKLVVGTSLVAIVAAMLLGSTVFQESLLKASKKIDKTGYSSRFLMMMMEDELTNANGRDAIQEKLLNEIQDDPLAIRGLFSDRQATRGLEDEEYSVTYGEGTYAHSLWIELLYDFGVIIGGCMLIVLCGILLRLLKSTDKESAYLVVIFVCTGVVYLLLSGSYLQCSEFFFLLGMSMNVQNSKRKTKF